MPILTLLLDTPYHAFQLLAFVAFAAYLAVAGRRQGWALDAILTHRALSMAGGLLAMSLVRIDLDADGTAPGRTVLSLLAGGALAMIIGHRLLPASVPAVLDLHVRAMPMAIAIGRLGCLLAGCCFGLPTSVPWGLRFAPGSHAYVAQQQAGLLAPGAHESLAVHPWPLYDALGALGIACWLRRRHWRREGSETLMVVGLYLANRAVLEFFRDGAPPSVLGVLRPVQLLLACSATACFATAWWREHQSAPLREPTTLRAPLPALPVAIADVAFAIAAWPVLGAFGGAVVLSFGLVAVGAVVAHQCSRHGARTVGAASTVAAFALLPPVIPDSIYPRTVWSIGGGLLAGRTVDEVIVKAAQGTPPNGEDCAPASPDYVPPVVAQRRHRYTLAGVEAGVRRERSSTYSTGLRGAVFGGSDKIGFSRERGGPSSYSPIGASLKADFDAKWLGASMGLLAGSMPVVADTVPTRVQPTGGLRIGKKVGVFGEVRINDFAPAPLLSSAATAMLGVGFHSGLTAKVGASAGNGTLWQADIPLRNGYELSPSFLAGQGGDRLMAVSLRRSFLKKARP
jgi:phosphatidylglycerol:prolipoprotein diacylglycerol transferase